MKQSIIFKNKPVIRAWASVAGKKESEGPYGACFDVTTDDDMFGGKNWEDAESRMQIQAVSKVIEKSGLKNNEIGAVVAGDLLGQLMATAYGAGGGVGSNAYPFLGVYGACSTMGESMAVASMIVSGGFMDNVVAMTSSHFASAERQFRFPLEYGNQRPLSATTTVTGSGAVIISSPENTLCEPRVQIEGVTIGKVEDYGVKDANNMGAAMAPAAYSVISANFRENNLKPDDYDLIVTGDLGLVGGRILKDMMRESGFDIEDRYMDCGIEIYDIKKQDAHSGGSGCGCSAITLCGVIFDKILNGEYENVLFVPTGALMSTVGTHEGNSIPSIAHAIMLKGVR